MSATKQRNASRTANTESLVGSSEKVLKQITELYTAGLSGGAVGGVGLKAIGDDKLLNMGLRKPHKKVSVMLIGNHSAGKSSFINWYIGENIQKTGVAIESRGFTFVTSGRKRETLTGDATVRFYDHLDDLTRFPGIMANLNTEITTSKEKNFSCVDFIDTPGLVDGDMQYPFDVEEAILWMADHMDLILIFFDPIGQATCKRTLQVVEKLNNGPHVEKIHYFMSKADAVEKEHDRQRVLIQITQNLATRIRNSHAFNLPTFYLPKEDDLPLGIPNAIEDVCKEIEKSINLTVQHHLKLLKADCVSIQQRIATRIVTDKAEKGSNMGRKFRAVLFFVFACGGLAALALLGHIKWLPKVCQIAVTSPLCSDALGSHANSLRPLVEDSFPILSGILGAVIAVFMLLFMLSWRSKPVLTRQDIKKLKEYSTYAAKIEEQEKGLYDEYFKTLSSMDHR